MFEYISIQRELEPFGWDVTREVFHLDFVGKPCWVDSGRLVGWTLMESSPVETWPSSILTSRLPSGADTDEDNWCQEHGHGSRVSPCTRGSWCLVSKRCQIQNSSKGETLAFLGL